MMPSGSSACLIARRAWIRPGGARRANSARFNWPMPCSAEIEPPAAVTRSSTKLRDLLALGLVPVGRGVAAGADVEVDVAVAQMAEAAGDDAGKGAFDLAAASTMNARHVGDGDRNVVRQRRPFGALGLGNGVAELPEGLGLGLVGGDHGVADDALLEARRRAALRAPPPMSVTGSAVVASTSTCQAMLPASGGRVPGTCLSTSSSESSGTSSNPSMLVGARFEEAQQIERAAPGFRPRPRRRRARRSPAPAAARPR